MFRGSFDRFNEVATAYRDTILKSVRSHYF
jgi:hypothetical protein